MTKAKKFKKKPVEIEAIQWTGKNRLEVSLFVGKELKCSIPPKQMEYERDDIPNDAYTLIISTLEGDMTAIKTDMIIKGVNGEFYPCKLDIFHKTYEEI